MQNSVIIEELIKSKLQEKSELLTEKACSKIIHLSTANYYTLPKSEISPLVYGALITGAKTAIEFLTEKGIINPTDLLKASMGENNGNSGKTKKG